MDKIHRTGGRCGTKPILVSERGTLVCNGCGEEKPTSQFYRDKTWASGFNRRCKTCSAPKDREQHSRPEVQAREAARKRAQYAARGRPWQYQREYNAKLPRAVRMFWSARARAKRDGIPFDITIDDVVVPERCPLLEIPITPARGQVGPRGHSPSLDRIDPTRGYVRGNVWVISYRANAIKQDATPEELEKIAANLRRRLHPTR